MLKTNLQKSIDFNGQNFYVGLDVHKKSWAVTIRSMGIQIAHFTQPPGAEALAGYFFPGGCYHSAYEAGFCDSGIHEQLCKLGINNILVHTGDIPSTDKQKKNKTNLHDGRAIAEHLQKGNLQGILCINPESSGITKPVPFTRKQSQRYSILNVTLKSNTYD